MDQRRGLDRLSRGLIVYGIVALVVAAISFGALIWVNNRIGNLRTEVTTTVGLLATTTADTASTLQDASTTAQTFSDTLGQDFSKAERLSVPGGPPRRGYNRRRRPGDREPSGARGKSGHRRAGRWGNPRRRKPTESGTERRPPPATTLRRRRR